MGFLVTLRTMGTTASATQTHTINVRSERYLSGILVHYALCSCGTYKSSKHGTKKGAERAGADHVAAKEAERDGH